MLPYAWDRELTKILAATIPVDARRALLGGNALRLFD
jgi:predicted TIM-barrel fold metal-dependent hydrolase